MWSQDSLCGDANRGWAREGALWWGWGTGRMPDQCLPRRVGMALHIQGRALSGTPKTLPQWAGASCSQPRIDSKVLQNPHAGIPYRLLSRWFLSLCLNSSNEGELFTSKNLYRAGVMSGSSHHSLLPSSSHRYKASAH